MKRAARAQRFRIPGRRHIQLHGGFIARRRGRRVLRRRSSMVYQQAIAGDNAIYFTLGGGAGALAPGDIDNIFGRHSISADTL